MSLRRARKLLSASAPGRGRPPPRRVRATPLRVSESTARNDIPPMHPNVVAPSLALRPPHPDANIYWGGLCKYTTGTIAPPDHVAIPLGIKTMSLKIYSHPSLFLRTWRLLDTLPQPSRLRNIESLGAYFDFAHLATEALFSVAASVRAVWLQLFSFGRPLANRSFQPPGRRLPVAAWDLSFQIYRDSSGASLSMPLVCLTIHDKWSTRLCRIRSGSGSASPGRLHVEFTGHTGRERLHSSTACPIEEKPISEDSQLRHPLDVVSKDICRTLGPSVAGQTFDSKESVLLSLKRALLRHLPTSRIATVLDLTSFQLTLRDEKISKGQRIVMNTLLNSDGSEQRPSETDQASVAQHSASRQMTPAGLQTHNKASPDIGAIAVIWDERTKPIPLSQRTREITGLPDLCVAAYLNNRDDPEHHVDSYSVINAFEGACQYRGRSGLADYAAIADALSFRFPLEANISLSSRALQEEHGKINDGLSILILKINDRNFDDGRKTSLRIHLPEMAGVEFAFASRTHPTVRAKTVKIHMTALYTELSGDGSQTKLVPVVPFPEEYAMLRDKSVAVLRKLCSEVTFDAWESVPQLVAEAILRTTSFANPRLVAWGARVMIAPDEGHELSTVSALASNQAVSPSSETFQTRPTVKHAGKARFSSDDSRLEIDKESSSAVAGDVATGAASDFEARLEDEVSDDDLSDQHRGLVPSGKSDGRVFIALGSNMGDRLKHIEDACNMIDADPDMKILRTSALYETDPMYVKDQDPFLNGVCEIDTSLPPIELLDRLQGIEQAIGRVKVVEKGPRTIDLDILMYRNVQMSEDRLTVPHPLLPEREFVLRPLCDLQRARRERPFYSRPTIFQLFQNIRRHPREMFAQIQFAPHKTPLQIDHPKRRTEIMAILNTTPDSFSDGGINNCTDRDQLRSIIESRVSAGATIIDIGGQSSRPNAPDVSAEEEIARILPALEAIKSSPEAADVVISVDTYRAAVAEAAIKAGAHVINDISAGQLDPEMLPTIARLGCTYVMMHMRGTPSTMQSEENCSYPDGLIQTIAKELWGRIDAAQDAGIRRWRIILDPGIGFSKTKDQNLEILRNLPELRRKIRQLPWLVGSSRKSFIGKITGVHEPKDRSWGTAATVTAAIQGGADIVRVHDVEEMAAVVKMSDAMYRV